MHRPRVGLAGRAAAGRGKPRRGVAGLPDTAARLHRRSRAATRASRGGPGRRRPTAGGPDAADAQAGRGRGQGAGCPGQQDRRC